MKSIFLALAISLALLLFGCTTAPSNEKPAASAGFDSLMDKQSGFYRDALSATSKNNSAAALGNSSALLAAWEKMLSYASKPPAGWESVPDFGKKITDAYAYVKKADSQIKEGKLQAAHYSLEPVRQIVLEMRTAAGKADHRDTITAFHSSMEKIVGPTESSSFSESDFAAMGEEMPYLMARFKELKEIDSNAIGLSSDGSAAWKEQIPLLNAGIVEMRAAIMANNTNMAKSAGQKIKAGYKKLFEMAG